MDIKELRITARMAMLELSETEMESFAREVTRTLEYFSQMNELDVDGLEPTTHVLIGENRLRSDIPAHDNLSGMLLDEAPQRDGRHIVIPNIL